MRYAKSGDYATWTCVRHIEDKKSCNMKYIREEHIKAAYVQMMNKLIAGKNIMLKPFVDTLRGGNNKDRLRHILELDEKIEKLNEQAQVLTKLLSSGYIELDVFYAENNNISLELDELEKEKASLSSIVSGDLNHLNEAQKLLRFINKSDCIKDFIDDTFSEFVEKITIEDRLKFTFHLKCGLNLTEEVIVK
ncbi:zinc ribbon domain-containing protein [Streptococcus suis]